MERPHLLGIDDGPFEKGTSADTPVVGVVMEGADVVEGVAVRRFPVDGDDATGFLADWIQGLRVRPSLHGVVLGGITLAGLGIVDVPALAERVELPVLVVNRRPPTSERLATALRAAGLETRLAVLERTPPAAPTPGGIHLACARIAPARAARLVAACTGKADLPEPLRLAHLIAAAIVNGSSRGRV